MMINLKNKTIDIEWKLKNQFGYSFSSIRLINQPSYLAAAQTPIEIMCTAYRPLTSVKLQRDGKQAVPLWIRYLLAYILTQVI